MKCVITVAGLGTRLLPLTKEMPKEMMPVYDKTESGELILKPMLQVIYESLYHHGIREYCFVVGRTKRAVEGHFTPDPDLVKFLKKEKKTKLSSDLSLFFKKLEKSNIVFTYQPKPIGFGDAIEQGKKFVGKQDRYFLLHAGDDLVIKPYNSRKGKVKNKQNHLNRLEQQFLKHTADIAFIIEKVKDPRKYGVVNGPFIEKGTMQVKEMQEKPEKPKSNYAIVAIYIFSYTIFEFLKEAKRKSNPEKQLAEAFNIALKRNKKLIGVLLDKNEKRIDIGTPETYSKTLSSFK